MEFRILGPMEVLDGSRRVWLPAGRGRALLAVLVLHAGEVVSSERLIYDLWGQTPPPTVNTAMHGLVSRLRKVLEPDRGKGQPAVLLRTAAAGYLLAVEPESVDANRFKRLLDHARPAPLTTRPAMLADALALWRGPALSDFEHEPFAQPAIAALEELRLVAIADRIDAELALGRHADLVPELEELIAMHPFRERLHGQLMRALYQAGQQAAALACFQAARMKLVEELGIEPGPALRDLEQAILRQDPSLGPAPAVEPLQPATAEVDRADHGTPWLPRERRVITAVFVELIPDDVDPDGGRSDGLGPDGVDPAASRSDGLWPHGVDPDGGRSDGLWPDGASGTDPESDVDPEVLRAAVAGALDIAGGIFARHGARVEVLVGGVIAAFFGLPVAHEDDAVRAVRAALEVKQAVAALNGTAARGAGTRLSMRAGVQTGEVVVGAAGRPHPGPSGMVLTEAAHLQQAAGTGDVLVGEATMRLVRGTAVLEPADRLATGGPRGPGSVWRALEVPLGDPGVPRRSDAPMFGRSGELTRLRTAFRGTVRRGLAYRLTVLGDAGIGKSRLAREFVVSIGQEARVVAGRCPSYGEGITFLPLREAVLDAAGPDGFPALVRLFDQEDDGAEVAEQIAGAIGLAPDPGNPERLFPAVRRLFEVLAARQPLVCVIEDLHWAEPTLLDLIDYLTETARGPVFLLCLARPQLTEARPVWGAGNASADTLFLEPLHVSEVEQLVADRAAAPLPPEAVSRIVASAQGNPLFAEQLLAALTDDWTERAAEVVPASLQSLLAMRLDRLGPGERDLLRCASVIGTEFEVAALRALVPDQARPFVDRHLETLESKQLTARASGTTTRFRHALIHSSAYMSMTREDRARLHLGFADWLETAATESPPEFDAVVGYHLEQAVEERRRIGLVDGATLALAVRAGSRLAVAGDRAFGRFDVSAAENLLTRARSLLPADHPRRSLVTRLLAEACQVRGQHAAADALLSELLDDARTRGDGAAERSVRLERARIQLFTGPDPTPVGVIRQEAERAARLYAEEDDDAGLARAFFVLGYVHLRAGDIAAMEEVLRSGLAHARRAGRIREELAAGWLLAYAIVLGPTPVADCLSACDELRVTQGAEHPGVLCELAGLHAMIGEFDEARALTRRARLLFAERMRVRRPLLFLAQANAAIERLAGDIEEAERHLRDALELARDIGEPDEASQTAARLSSVLLSAGRPAEAAEHARLSVESAPAVGVAAAGLSRVAAARVSAASGMLRDARRLAREAVDAVPAEMLNLRAELLVEVAEVLHATGDHRDAVDASAEATRLYMRKGNVVMAARTATPP